MANPLTRLIDPVDDHRDRVARPYQIVGDWRAWGVPLALGGVLVLLSMIGLLQDSKQFWFAYLTGWAFCLSMTIGALIFVMIQHVVKAKWVTVVRRFPEVIMVNFGWLTVAAVPFLLFGMYDLYHWTHPELYEVGGAHFDGIVAGKVGYFYNFGSEPGGIPVFFYLRAVVYFAVWITLSNLLFRLSVEQDVAPRADVDARMRFHSAWGIPVMAITVSFASFDFLMSLDPHWFSTIFGVYFFAGGFVAAVGLMTLLALSAHRKGLLAGEATVEHFHDFGKYLFGFTVFWAYIWFSQHMLIWYANIPEETIWFEHRDMHGWGLVTQMLILFHFVLPFFLLISRVAKRTVPILAIMAGWIVTIHFVDLWWIIKPNLLIASGMDLAYEDAALSWMDLTLGLGFFALMLGFTFWRQARHAVAPYNDPFYRTSLHFENV